MPSFGMYTAEGRLVSWLAASGSHVEKGQPVLEIETDKAVQEVIAPDSGILQTVVSVGAPVKEEQLLGYVLADGEPQVTGHAVAASLEDDVEASRTRPTLSAPTRSHAAAASARIVATPEARRLAARHGIDLSTVVGSGPGGRIVAADVSVLVSGGG